MYIFVLSNRFILHISKILKIKKDEGIQVEASFKALIEVSVVLIITSLYYTTTLFSPKSLLHIAILKYLDILWTSFTLRNLKIPRVQLDQEIQFKNPSRPLAQTLIGVVSPSLHLLSFHPIHYLTLLHIAKHQEFC
jgi:hypothetical protein